MMVDIEIEDPLIRETKILGIIDRNKILEAFSEYDLDSMNTKLEEGRLESLFHNPSMYFKDRENRMEVCFSLLGKTEDYEFSAFFVR